MKVNMSVNKGKRKCKIKGETSVKSKNKYESENNYKD